MRTRVRTKLCCAILKRLLIGTEILYIRSHHGREKVPTNRVRRENLALIFELLCLAKVSVFSAMRPTVQCDWVTSRGHDLPDYPPVASSVLPKGILHTARDFGIEEATSLYWI